MKFYKDGKDLGMTVKPDQGALNEARRKMFEATDKLIMQRSETMETYSLPEALAKAKAGATMTMGNLVIKYDGTYWTMYEDRPLTGPDYQTMAQFVDVDEWQEEQPEIQPGDWVARETPAGIKYGQVFSVEPGEGVEVQFQGEEYQAPEPTQPTFSTYKFDDVVHITNQRIISFLEGGRQVNEFKQGDLVSLTTHPGIFEVFNLEGPTKYEGMKRAVKIDELTNRILKEKLEEVHPVCFVELRMDRREEP